MEDLKQIDKLFGILESKDDAVRYSVFKELLQITEKQVSWIYDKWFVLIEKLSSENSYQRSIGLMLLANLAKSDSENRFSKILDKYLEFFEDEKFITSRQCIQNVWKIALVHDSNKKNIIQELEKSYYENINHNKHSNLIKQDVISSLNQIYQSKKDESLMNKINQLIDSEVDDKLRKALRKVIKSSNKP